MQIYWDVSGANSLPRRREPVAVTDSEPRRSSIAARTEAATALVVSVDVSAAVDNADAVRRVVLRHQEQVGR